VIICELSIANTTCYTKNPRRPYKARKINTPAASERYLDDCGYLSNKLPGFAGVPSFGKRVYGYLFHKITAINDNITPDEIRMPSLTGLILPHRAMLIALV